MEHKRQIKQFVLKNYLFTEDESALGDGDSLIRGGTVDSTGMLELIAHLEETYAIKVADADGAVFGLNSASDGRNVIISPRATGFEAQLRERGYNPVLVDLSELLLGGGGIKCCTLELRR